ncbi:Arrestin-related trafficking adapter 10 [Lachancea thermotolerans]
MGPKLKLLVNKPANGEFHVSNEAITGKVVLELEKPAPIKELSVTMRGTSQTIVEMTPEAQNLIRPHFPMKSSHTLVNQKRQLFPPANVSKALDGPGKGFQVTKGSYSYEFELNIPHWLKCMGDHGPRGAGFNKDEEEPRLPPSFNSIASQAPANDPISFYHKMGTVTYYVKAQLILGKSMFRLTPSDPILEAYEVINFFPDPNKERSSAGRTQSFVSKKAVQFEKELSARLEVRAKRLQEVHRLDHLFKSGSRRLDRVYLVFETPPPPKFALSITRCRLQLVEVVNYLSAGHINAVTGLIPILDVPLDRQLDPSRIRCLENGTAEWPLDLSKNPELASYRFNEENLIFQGNKLFSFVCCNIRRAFKFHLTLTLSANGKSFEIDMSTTTSAISLASAEEHEPLPRYDFSDAPPVYLK